MVMSRPGVAFLLLLTFLVRTGAGFGAPPCEPAHHAGGSPHAAHATDAEGHEAPGQAPAGECDHHGPASAPGTTGECAHAVGCVVVPVLSAPPQVLHVAGALAWLADGPADETILRPFAPTSPPPKA